MAKQHGTEVSEDEQDYAALADEMNDVQRPGEEPYSLDDFDQRAVKNAERYARAQGLDWPPSIGDYDRYCERKWDAERRAVAMEGRR